MRAPIPRHKHTLAYYYPAPVPRVGWWANHRRILRWGLGPMMRTVIRAENKQEREEKKRWGRLQS